MTKSAAVPLGSKKSEVLQNCSRKSQVHAKKPWLVQALTSHEPQLCLRLLWRLGRPHGLWF